jgi:arginine exporter protein ArgO
VLDRYLLILLALVILGTVGAFFLFAPILPTMVASVMLIGLIAMFWLGLHLAKPPAETNDEDSTL